MVQSIARCYDDVTVARLRYIMHRAHPIDQHVSLPLKLSVQDHDTGTIQATPELLVDDTQTSRLSWQLLLRLLHPLFRARLLQRHWCYLAWYIRCVRWGNYIIDASKRWYRDILSFSLLYWYYTVASPCLVAGWMCKS